MTSYFLTSDRLGFRCWRDSDLALALDLWGDPDVTRPIDARSPLSVDEVRALLSDQIATERDHGVQYWPIFLLAEAGHPPRALPAWSECWQKRCSTRTVEA